MIRRLPHRELHGNRAALLALSHDDRLLGVSTVARLKPEHVRSGIDEDAGTVERRRDQAIAIEHAHVQQVFEIDVARGEDDGREDRRHLVQPARAVLTHDVRAAVAYARREMLARLDELGFGAELLAPLGRLGAVSGLIRTSIRRRRGDGECKQCGEAAHRHDDTTATSKARGAVRIPSQRLPGAT
jgi:hypothetical protein